MRPLPEASFPPMQENSCSNFLPHAGRPDAMPRIDINIKNQVLDFIDDNGKLVKRYPISSAKNGVGEQWGSLCTPRGKHIVRAKVGSGHPANTVFVERRPTGETYSPEL